jgi:hypothetical protein
MVIQKAVLNKAIYLTCSLYLGLCIFEDSEGDPNCGGRKLDRSEALFQP